jgi:hypothetical protein
MLWSDMREKTKKIHKELQDLDPIGSPHLEEILIGEKIDRSRSPLTFPQKDAKHGTNGEGEQANQSQ